MMERTAVPIREIVSITDELARYWRDHHLMDQLTVTRGYAELTQLDSSNLFYFAKLQIALQRLAEMVSERGLRSIAEQIRAMGIRTALRAELSRSTGSLG